MPWWGGISVSCPTDVGADGLISTKFSTGVSTVSTAVIERGSPPEQALWSDVLSPQTPRLTSKMHVCVLLDLEP